MRRAQVALSASPGVNIRALAVPFDFKAKAGSPARRTEGDERRKPWPG
jgi:hypothetical protein